MIQRRRWERCRKELQVVVDPDGASRSTAMTVDVCEGGIGFVCDGTFDIGSTIRFAIEEIAPGAMSGIVRWCTPSKGSSGYIIGVELNALSASHRDALADKLALWRSQAADEDA